MEVTHKIKSKLEKILNRLKVLNIIDSFHLKINFCEVEDNLKPSVLEVDSVLRKCLHKLVNKPRRAEIRNIISELVRKKNLSDVPVKEITDSSERECSDKLDDNDEEFEQSDESSGAHYKCDDCEDLFITKKHLIAHKKIHKKITKYLCEICGEGFPDLFDWDIHKQSCTHEEKPILLKKHQGTDNHKPCSKPSENHSDKEAEVCEDPVAYENAIKEHLLEHLKSSNESDLEEDPKFICACGRIFRLLKSLKKHEKVKHSVKNMKYDCSVCEKSFEEKGKLNRHMLTHKSSQFDCSICSKLFVRSDALKRHLSLVHCSEKQFSCRFCDKKFNLKYNKNVHEENSHKNSNNWVQCDLCGQKCRNKITFKSHLKTHSEKRFICDTCGKSFVRKSQYNDHFKNRHVGIPVHESLLGSVLRGEHTN